MTTNNFCFYLQNRLIQTSQTGGQWYSDTSPFSIPCSWVWSTVKPIWCFCDCPIYPKSESRKNPGLNVADWKWISPENFIICLSILWPCSSILKYSVILPFSYQVSYVKPHKNTYISEEKYGLDYCGLQLHSNGSL